MPDKIVHRPSFAVVRSFRDQLERADDIDAATLAQVARFVDRADRFMQDGKSGAASAQLHAIAQQLKHDERFANLVDALEALADA